MRGCSALVVFLFITQIVISQTFTRSNLPIIFIDTQGKNIPDEPKITAWMSVLNDADGVNNVNDTDFEYDGYIGIEIRGNTSQIFFQKKSFNLETRTDSGTNLNVSLLGLPEENDWVLYGPFSDKSLMRNALAYHLGNSTNRWSPRTKFCEMFINDTYEGVYVFTERIKIDKNRVNIARLKPEDNSGDELTGGYIMRIDRDRPGSWNSPFMGRTGSVDVPISYFDPKYTELTDAQKSYIREYITDFEYALHGENFKDPHVGYRAYIDVTSWVDYFFISELSRDLDGYRVSVYFHKDKDSKGGKLNMSPWWDYNLGFGNGDFFAADKTEGWVADGLGSGDWYEIPFWWDKLREDPYFNTILKYRWQDLRNNSFSKESIFTFIDSCAYLLLDAQKRNFERFDILDQYVWPNPYIGGTYSNEINYLKSWISARLDWLDSQIDQIVPLSIEDVYDESIEDMDRVMIYPNPFKEFITMSFFLKRNSNIDIIIRNLLGKTLIHRSMKYNEGVIEIKFTEGDFNDSGNVFIYTILVDGKLLRTGKIIKY